MCKVTRNPQSALVSRDVIDDKRSQANAIHSQGKHHRHIIHAKHDHPTDKLTTLPTYKHNTDSEVQVRAVDKDENKEGCSNVNVFSGNANMSASLRAISALCLRKPPNIIPGVIIRECLLGQVSRGTFVSDNNECASVVVKEFNLTQVLNKTTKNGRGLHEDALVELQIHTYIQRKRIRNVIGLYGMHLNESSNKLHAYLEYADKGELFSIVQQRGLSGLPLEACGNYFVQLLRGIADLHSINVVHRDLSLENVLVTEANEIKICDFGLATICAPGVTINDGRVIGKVNYMCPELYYGEQYDPRKVDIWSAAVIFFLMLTGVFPYERPSVEDPRLVMVCNGRINELLAHWQGPTLDEELLQMFSKMFCPPQQRWNAQQLLQLPFCQRFNNVSTAAKTANNAIMIMIDSSDVISRDREAESQTQASTPSMSASTITRSHSISSDSVDTAVTLSMDIQSPGASSPESFPARSSVASPSPSYTRHKFFLSSESNSATVIAAPIGW